MLTNRQTADTSQECVGIFEAGMENSHEQPQRRIAVQRHASEEEHLNREKVAWQAARKIYDYEQQVSRPLSSTKLD
jgi:hypothetical protein